MIHHERVGRLLEADNFKKKLGEVAAFTYRTRKEAGFMAYATKTAFRLSTIVRAQAKDYVHDIGTTNNAYNSLKMAHLAWEFKGESRSPRTNILFGMHSHPFRDNMPPRLRPSIADLEFDESYRIHNPEAVTGIMALHAADRGSLLLYRRADAARPNFYQRHADSTDSQVLLQSMRDSGMTMAVLDFVVENRATIYEPEQVSQVMQTLYSDKS